MNDELEAQYMQGESVISAVVSFASLAAGCVALLCAEMPLHAILLGGLGVSLIEGLKALEKPQESHKREGGK